METHQKNIQKQLINLCNFFTSNKYKFLKKIQYKHLQIQNQTLQYNSIYLSLYNTQSHQIFQQLIQFYPAKKKQLKTKNMLKPQINDEAISLLISQIEQNIIVQVINLKKMKTHTRLSCQISDGYYKIRAYITDEKIVQSDNLAFIQITSYGMLKQNQKPVGIVVHSCKVVGRYMEILGQPIDYLKERNTGKVNKQNALIIMDEKYRSANQKIPIIKKQQLATNNNKNNQHNGHNGSPQQSGPIVKTSPTIQQRKVQMSSPQMNQVLKNYQKITDLYPDFPNWQILARLVKKNYKQFISSKGKQTKVLNLQFMDNAGWRITGALFGDSAKQYYNALKQDQIYQVSKGQIRQDQYSKGKNYSKYSIMFTRQSQFRLCQNTQLVPHHGSTLKNLHYVNQNRKIGEQYDAVCILLNIQNQVQIPKDNKTLYKQTLQICDPVNDLLMDAVIWNRHITVDQKFVGKVVGLFGFRLNQYQDKLSLNSSYQSEIKLLDNHQYNKYCGKIIRDKMQILSQKKDRNIIQTQQPCKNLKQLQTQIVYLQPGKQIKSTLTLILTFISPKKWFYQSCPYCRRSTQASNRCNNCQKYVQDTIPRYKLNVELSDYCGSIWATGFQQLGTKIFSDYPQGIKGLKNLEDNQRQRQFEKKQFQQYTIRLNTKHDKQGGIKHTINRIYDCNIMNRIQENIKRIKNHV